jgi:hypothetical protein
VPNKPNKARVKVYLTSKGLVFGAGAVAVLCGCCVGAKQTSKDKVQGLGVRCEC